MTILGAGPVYLGEHLIAGGGGGDSEPEAWVRPADWLTLPTLTSSDKKVVGLIAVYPHDANFLAVNCAGAYTVDWGDGSAPENIASGVQANHLYSYADADLAGTECSRGYKQAIVTITPQGATWTTINLGVRHSQSGLAAALSSPWLDVAMAGSAVTTLTIRTTTITPRLMEQFTWVGPLATTTLFGLFNGCAALQSVPLFDTAAATTMANMFQNCYSLRSVPLFDTAAVTTMASMFASCSSLGTVPLFNTAAVTDMTAMFSGCSSLQTVPLFNTAAVILMASMFNNCPSLQTVPLFNTAAVTNMSSMFQSCQALQSVPLFNTANVINFASIFGSCPSLSAGAMNGTKVSISYSGCRLSAAALDAIYTNLASGVTAQTITVSSNYGTTGDTPSIATAKGWTVTG